MKMKLPSTVFSAEPSSKMKTIAIVFLCFFFALNTLAQKFRNFKLMQNMESKRDGI